MTTKKLLLEVKFNIKKTINFVNFRNTKLKIKEFRLLIGQGIAPNLSIYVSSMFQCGRESNLTPLRKAISDFSIIDFQCNGGDIATKTFKPNIMWCYNDQIIIFWVY